MATERMDPQACRWFEHGVRAEHLARYAFAAERVRGAALDIACGTGYGTAMLARHADVVGVDLAADAIDTARQRSPGLALQTGDATALPFEARRFDWVVSFETIEHVPREAVPAALAEFARVLKPGGRLVISTPERRSYSLGGPTGNPFHEAEFTQGEFERLLSPHFTIDSVHGQKFSRPATLGLAKASAKIIGHPAASKLWRAYKMVVRQDAQVAALSARPDRVPLLLVVLATKKEG